MYVFKLDDLGLTLTQISENSLFNNTLQLLLKSYWVRYPQYKAKRTYWVRYPQYKAKRTYWVRYPQYKAKRTYLQLRIQCMDRHYYTH